MKREGKCACEAAYRQSFVGRIFCVNDKEAMRGVMAKLREKLPMEFLQPLYDSIKKSPDEQFGLGIKMEEGGEVWFGYDLIPVTKEWAQARLGDKLRFVLTQLPNRGPCCLDIAEISK